MLNLHASSAILFALGVSLTAIGHGMTMLAGMGMITRLAGPANRSGLLATYLVAGYVGSMIPMMGIGWIADHWGIEAAIYSFCTMVIAIGVPVAVLFQRHPRIRPAMVQPAH
ncbi:MFS transporter [Advenella kashmirensis]|uniref:MFS transporter n=1 Tax=Advenella kashmirensis TaxID=310575 RepID=UPI001EE67025|nr:MFS transporter [Advenella kashmirensis]